MYQHKIPDNKIKRNKTTKRNKKGKRYLISATGIHTDDQFSCSSYSIVAVRIKESRRPLNDDGFLS